MGKNGELPRYPRRPWITAEAEVLFGPVDPRPVEIPIEMLAPPSLEERLAEMIRREISRAARHVGAGTFEEEDDFDLPDDEEVFSDYQVLAMAEDEAPAADSLPVDPGEAPQASDSPETAPEEGAGGRVGSKDPDPE